MTDHVSEIIDGHIVRTHRAMVEAIERDGMPLAYSTYGALYQDELTDLRRAKRHALGLAARDADRLAANQTAMYAAVNYICDNEPIRAPKLRGRTIAVGQRRVRMSDAMRLAQTAGLIRFVPRCGWIAVHAHGSQDPMTWFVKSKGATVRVANYRGKN